MANGMMVKVKTQDLQEQSGSYLDKAKSLKVTSEDTYAQGAEGLRDLVTFTKQVKLRFKPALDAQKKGLEETRSIQADILKVPTEAEGIIRGKMLTFQEKKRKDREEQEAKAREKAIADAKAKRDKELAELEASDAPFAKEKAEELAEEPITPEAIDVSTRPIKQDVTGVAQRQIWKAKVTDLEALIVAIANGKCPAHYIKADLVEIGKVVRASKGEIRIPGVHAYAEENIAVRAR